MYRPKVYTASKIRHKQRWLGTEIVWGARIEFTARWIRQPDTPDLSDLSYWGPDERTRLWLQNIQDVQRSDYVLSYADPRDLDTVKGTLVEIGCAIGLGKMVLVTGYDNHHSWMNHPLVRQFEDIGKALYFLTGFPIEERQYVDK